MLTEKLSVPLCSLFKFQLKALACSLKVSDKGGRVVGWLIGV